MADVNKVILIGRLGRDPEMKYTKSGTAVANFNLATSEKWKGQGGDWESCTEWHRIVAWKGLAEICGKYLTKGSQIYIEGKLQTRSWDDKDGNKRYVIEIVAQTMQMLGGGKSEPQDEPAPVPEDDIPF